MSQFIEMFGNYETNANFGDLFSSARNGANIKQGTISGGIPITRIETISEGEINRDKMGYAGIVDNTYSSYYLQDGDILVSHINSMKHIGKCALYQRINDETIIHGMNLLCLRPYKDIVNPQYVTYLLRSSIMRKLILDITKPAVNQASFTVKDLCKLKVMLPPISEQEEFVTIVKQADKSEFVGCKSQFIEMFAFQDLSLTNPSDDFAKKCYDDTSSATKVPAGDYQNNGRYAIYDQSQDCDIAGYTDSIEGVCNNYPAVLFGDHSRVIKYINQPFYIGADGVKIIRPKGDDLLPEFLYYDLLYHNIPNTGYNRHFKYVKMLKLTEASIDEQEEFLKIAHQADKSEYYN